jgi:hypothetical protein
MQKSWYSRGWVWMKIKKTGRRLSSASRLCIIECSAVKLSQRFIDRVGEVVFGGQADPFFGYLAVVE